MPSSIQVAAGQTKQFEVKLVDASKLPTWTLNGGPRGGDGFRLQGVEFDGYISINAGANDNVHVAWQVLPHRAAEFASIATRCRSRADPGRSTSAIRAVFLRAAWMSSR